MRTLTAPHAPQALPGTPRTGTEAADVLHGTLGDDWLQGGGGDDWLDGGLGNDLLEGGEGHDQLRDGGGLDTLVGGAGNDLYRVTATTTQLVEQAGQGHDVVVAAVDWTLGEALEELRLTASATALNGTGNALDNRLLGNALDNVLLGLGGHDALWGADGADTLSGGAGRDTLDGGRGDDLLSGGADDDTYRVDSVGDLVQESADRGHDTVRASVDYTLGQHLEDLVLTGTARLATGNALDNLLTGNGQDNLLTGGAGRDTLEGAGGHDTLVGGEGDDYYRLRGLPDEVVELAGQGTDTVESNVSHVLAEAVENLVLTSAALRGTGNALDNHLTGTAGANVLDGGAGVDTLVGGAGNDLYLVDDTADQVIERAGEGWDKVRSSVSYTLGEHLERLVLTGTAYQAIGNALDNQLKGNEVGNLLDGGAGRDTLTGGLGDDLYRVDDTGDVVEEGVGEGEDTVEASVDWTLGSGVEHLQLTGAAVTGTGHAGDNHLRGNAGDNLLSGLEGHDLLQGDGGDDVLQGGTGNDTLAGEAGVDLLIGGGGDDIYTLDDDDDLVVERTSEGRDTVVYGVAGGAWTLAAQVENLILTGTALTGRGNALDNQLTGNAQDNLLQGDAGHDTLDGGAGADTLDGGSGDDLLFVDHTAEEVRGGDGDDTVQASVAWALGADLENLVLTGNDDLTGTGNTLDNRITGNDGANTLDGGAGADTLDGGTGNDLFIVDTADDQVLDAGGQDTVRASASYTLGEDVEVLELTGGASLSGTGNALANLIQGNDGDNTLDGGAGADLLYGGLGNDLYLADDTGDLVGWDAGGQDTVQASVDHTLGVGVETLILTHGAQTGIGNALDNLIVGTDGDNTLDGSLGQDTLRGGLGNDTYVVDDNVDIVIDDGGEDTIVSKLFGINLNLHSWPGIENVRLHEVWFHPVSAHAMYPMNATGDQGNNQLWGNSIGNSLYGMGGDDSLYGGDGADELEEYSGANLLDGGGGDDILRVECSNNTLLGGDGRDQLYVRYGASGAQWLDGGEGNDRLIIQEASAGRMTLEGGLGDDDYHLSGAPALLTDIGGHDTVAVLDFDWVLPEGIDNVELDSSGARHEITGNALNNRIDGSYFGDDLAGAEGDDLLVGHNGDDLLSGGTGQDTLSGGEGRNTLVGGAGSDLIQLWDGQPDTVVLNDTGGHDTVTGFHPQAVLALDAVTLRLGNGDAVVDSGTVQAQGQGFSSQAEVVIFSQAAASLAAQDAADFLGSADGAFVQSDARVFVVNDGTDTGVYLFQSADSDATVSASELTLLATLSGTVTVDLPNLVFSV
ncbi:calcium-binding protein [Ideonella livida]|uniref:Calcium-binding protein n=1 Tax=Ideonella livida TaxID=2707176 RepID=A0A7C9TIR0_9BURK|nr:calcium-binding protein [Ideonella livida]NDY91499.1 calcium-binding protein [Ideonella livida]